jgi:hypothetical protein
MDHPVRRRPAADRRAAATQSALPRTRPVDRPRADPCCPLHCPNITTWPISPVPGRSVVISRGARQPPYSAPCIREARDSTHLALAGRPAINSLARQQTCGSAGESGRYSAGRAPPRQPAPMARGLRATTCAYGRAGSATTCASMAAQLRTTTCASMAAQLRTTTCASMAARGPRYNLRLWPRGLRGDLRAYGRAWAHATKPAPVAARASECSVPGELEIGGNCRTIRQNRGVHRNPGGLP